MGKVGISFALGGSIAAVVMVIGMITLVAGTATTTTATSAMDLYGHYTIKVMDPDGNIKAYVQTNNAPTHIFKDCLFEAYFTTMPSITAATCSIATATLQIGDGGETAPLDSDTVLGNPYTNSGSGTAVVTGQTSSVASDTTVTWDNTASVITISQTDLDASTTGSVGDGVCIDTSASDGNKDCFLDETGLFDDDGDLISHAAFTQIEVSVGDQVDITLVITLT